MLSMMNTPFLGLPTAMGKPTIWPLLLMLTVGVFSLLPSPAVGWQDDEPSEEDIALVTPIIREFAIGELEQMSVAALRKLYDAEIETLRQSCKDLQREGARFFHASSNDARTHSKAWKQMATAGKKSFQRLKELTMVLYLKSPQPDEDLSVMARVMNTKCFSEGRLDICYKVNKKLKMTFPEEQIFQDDFARIAAFNNDFKNAAEFLEDNQATVMKFPMFEQSLFTNLDSRSKSWDAELEIRKKEALADDLPRVEIITSKGKIVVELFENEAPHTVGNFVSLIDADFYKDLIFHVVIRNYKATGGILTLDDARTTGYEIFDESTANGTRNAFRGSVSMIASESASEFSINLSPEPFTQPNAKPTIIGRVIEGMEVVESLNVTAKIGAERRVEVLQNAQPDFIKSTRVIRKRPDTEYVPKIVED